MYVGWFAPEYKFLAEAWTDIIGMISPVLAAANMSVGVMRSTTGGRVDFWSLDNERAGRSRHYHDIIIDEAAFTKPSMFDIWRKSIRPTLVDFRGSATVLSNTNGISDDNFLYKICNDPQYGFVQYHAPTHANPYMPAEELADLEAQSHPLVWQQEYLAEFVDWSGQAFFSLESLLIDARPIPCPTLCDGVLATIDTAVKDRSEHDGSGVIYWAYNKHFAGPKLAVLDYDLIQIEGSLLEVWLPQVYERLEVLARECRARFGSLGTWIEDKASGSILIQQARRRGWQVQPIDNDLVSLGKDARCINVSGYVHRGDVKLTEACYDRVLTYKGTSRNHLLGQVIGYRVGIDQDEDDLLDCFTYGIAMACGDQRGF
jgi:hypothetical protein